MRIERRLRRSTAPLCASRRRRATALAWILGLTGCATVASSQGVDANALRIFQFNVGQGDAALIVTPEGKRILIDAGRNDRDVPGYLTRLQIDTLDLVVASHNHADHIGGMPAVFGLVVVRAYMDNGLPHTTNIYRQTLTAVEAEPSRTERSIAWRYCSPGSVTLKVLPPSMLDNSQNNNSVGILVEYGKFRALFTGDSEQPQLQKWLLGGLVARATLVKAAHHGSWNGVTPEFIEAVTPEIVVISVGSNSYGHPAPAVERQWRSVGAKVYRTDQRGTLELRAFATGEVSVMSENDPPSMLSR